MVHRIVAAGREVRTMLDGAARASEMRASGGGGDMPPGGTVPSTAAYPHGDPGRADAVAGCEYLDDRIRLTE